MRSEHCFETSVMLRNVFVVLGALQDTGRGGNYQCIFLTSLLPPDILCGSSFFACGAGESTGGVAQLGERLNGIQEVRGSIPLTSIPVRLIELVFGCRDLRE